MTDSALHSADSPIGPVCEILVTRVPESGHTFDNWFDIWTAGVDIYNTCIIHGFPGIVKNLGMYLFPYYLQSLPPYRPFLEVSRYGLAYHCIGENGQVRVAINNGFPTTS